MQKWEYKVHVVDNDGDGADTFSIDVLNEFGDEGWELLHVNKLQDAANIGRVAFLEPEIFILPDNSLFPFIKSFCINEI